MKKRVFNKLKKNGYTTFEKIKEEFVPRLLKTYKREMKNDRQLRKDIRRMVTQVLMGEKIGPNSREDWSGEGSEP
jgi:hypothetical protein